MRRTALLLVFLSFLATGCAHTEPPRLQSAPQLLAEVSAAPQRPVELPAPEQHDVLSALRDNPTSAARAFGDPELKPGIWASFWRSPLNGEVDPNRLLLVRYGDEGNYVYIGFGRDGAMFTSGTGGLFADPPWSQ